MDMPSIMWAALIGAAGGVIGYLLSLLFPQRMRVVVIGVVIALAIGGTSTIKSFIEQEMMTPERFERQVMEDLQSNNEGVHKIMLLYKENEPELYGSIMEKASSAYKEGKGKDALADIIRAEISNYMTLKIKELSDDGILEYTDILTKQFEQLGAEGQDSICMKMLRNEQLGAVEWSDAMIDLEYQLARGVVMDNGGSGEVAEQKQVDDAVTSAIAELRKMHGEEKVSTVFGGLSAPGAAPEGTCVVFADYFKHLKKAAEPNAARILRTIFTAES